MTPRAKNSVIALSLVAIGLAFAAAGIYVGETDDAPGAAGLGFLLMISAVALAVRIARRHVSPQSDRSRGNREARGNNFDA